MSASAWAYSNGEIVPLEQARYWPNDLAIIYGEIVYEATRTFGGQPFKLQAHIERLYRSLRYCRMDPGLTPAELTAVTLEVLERNRPELPDGSDLWLFHNISRGSHPQFQDVGRGDAGPTVLVWTHELGFKYWFRQYEDGAQCVTPSVRQIGTGTQDPRMKTRSRMVFALAEQEVSALAPGAYPLLLDSDGRITEATGANFMLVCDGVILTPRSGSGLAGVSLSTVRELSLDLGVECARGRPDALRCLHRRRGPAQQHPLLRAAGNPRQRRRGGRRPTRRTLRPPDRRLERTGRRQHH